MKFDSNPQLQLAYDFVQYTGKNIFLTGKAGTGKTTFLHKIKDNIPKRMIVVAPTGVAAINAGGVTIHSFFQLAFGPFVPVEGDPSRGSFNPREPNHKLSRDKIDIMKSLDLLVIDEISMVRADLLDGIDDVLRRYKNRHLPFGGVQLLMIGDIQQLSPVVKDDEWSLLRNYYDTMFFFSSRALRQTQFVSIELKHIYRQSDAVFIDILNKVRENSVDEATLAELNKRFDPQFSLNAPEGYITLTTHNAQAQGLNEAKLRKLPGDNVVYQATIKGDFPEYLFPTDLQLTLKAGAQVMFVKNDGSRDKLFFNGKIGVIESFEEDHIMVKCAGDMASIPVVKAEWKNTKYTINSETKEIEEDNVGSFEQYPLKLAWAITIHKSQGLTFEKAIIDANAAFAHGQVYVALSRCKSLDGLVLSSKISVSCIKSDVTVTTFSRDVEQNPPSTGMLQDARNQYQQALVYELFDFSGILRRLQYVSKLTFENSSILHPSLHPSLQTTINDIQIDLVGISIKFKHQINHLLATESCVELNAGLQDRIIKATGYFLEKISSKLVRNIADLTLDCDNKAVKKTITDALAKVTDEVAIKLGCLQSCSSGFSVKNYLDARAKASIQKLKTPATSDKNKTQEIVSTNKTLFSLLRSWRNDKADELNVPAYVVMHQTTLNEIANQMPASAHAIAKIKGMGKKRATSYADEIITVIKRYSDAHGIEYTPETSLLDDMTEENDSEQEAQGGKTNTKQSSMILFREGKTVAEIAQMRGLTENTIDGHLAYYVGTGEIDATKLIDPGKLALITGYYAENPASSAKQAKDALGDTVMYNEIHVALKHLAYISSQGK